MGEARAASTRRIPPRSPRIPMCSPRSSARSTKRTPASRSVEQIKRWTLLADEWLPDSEELTPTMKLKRRGVHRKYADEIAALYD